MPGTARIGPTLTKGLLGAITHRRRASAIAASTPGAGRAARGAAVARRPSRAAARAAARGIPGTRGRRRRCATNVRTGSSLIGSTRACTPRRARQLGASPRDSGRRRAAGGAQDVRREVAVAEREPAGPAERGRAPPSTANVSPSMPQPRSDRREAGERVEDGVEVGRDVQAVELVVVAGVDDDGEVVAGDHAGEAAQEAGGADAAGQHRDRSVRGRAQLRVRAALRCGERGPRGASRRPRRRGVALARRAAHRAAISASISSTDVYSPASAPASREMLSSISVPPKSLQPARSVSCASSWPSFTHDVCRLSIRPRSMSRLVGVHRGGRSCPSACGVDQAVLVELRVLPDEAERDELGEAAGLLLDARAAGRCGAPRAPASRRGRT